MLKLFGVTGVWALTDSELSTSLTRVFAEEQALAAQRLALVREIDGRGLPSREGATSTIAWLRDTLRISVRTARQMVELAKALDTNLSTTGQALADGVVNEEQALVIARAVGKLPADTQAKAEDFLLDKAATFEPATLLTLGRRVLDTVAPELADEQLAKDLKAADARAARDRTLTLSPDGTGRVRLTGWL
ncbi:MAG TPA: HNH endonuclease, partial [Micromonosporaceae bacterium]|nr:HNH endonuclease [Micromonosporaceae bacterium]